MRFEFATVPRILFGSGTLKELKSAISGLGRRPLLVASASSPAERVCDELRSAGCEPTIYTCSGEPTLQTIDRGVELARSAEVDFVVGVGGGSVIDAAKAIAGLLTNPGELLDYLEVVGHGKALTRPAAPWIAIPTTAGTGAEVTRNAVIGVPDKALKVSLRSSYLFARVALVDPELTLGVPPHVTAATGMDALTQLIESYVSIRATPFTDALCVDAIPRVAHALTDVWRNPADLAARTGLSYGALSSGIALANSGLGAVHGFASVLGGRYGAPHGAVCAALLAPICRINVEALQARASSSEQLARYKRLAELLTGNAGASISEGSDYLAQLVSTLRIPRLRDFGVEAGHETALLDGAQHASSTKGNPIVLSREELAEALRDAL